MKEIYIERFGENERRKGIFLFIFYVIVIVFGGEILQIVGNRYLADNATFVWYCILSIIILTFFGSTLRESALNIKKRLLKNFVYLLVIGFTTLIFMIIASILINNFGIVNQNQVEVNYALKNQRTLMLIATCLLAPITEEFVYRYILFRSLRSYNIFLSHLITSLMFGFLHVWFYVIMDKNLLALFAMLPTFIIGLGCSITYEKTKNILFPILLHMAINLMSSI